MTRRYDEVVRWMEYTANVRRRPETPFNQQWARFNEIYFDDDPALPPPPAWIPDEDRLTNSNLAAFMNEIGSGNYRELHRWSTTNRPEFWRRILARLGIVFGRPPDNILDLTRGPDQPAWLPGAQLNIVDSCFQPSDCTVAVAVGHEGSEAIATYTYGELETLVNRVANGLMGILQKLLFGPFGINTRHFTRNARRGLGLITDLAQILQLL